MLRTTLATLFVGYSALAAASRDPQNPFPAPTSDGQGAGRWSTFWWADFDGDGALDALVLHPSAPARLYRNAGEGRFEDVTQTAGLAGILGARQALWADFDGDGRLDLFLTVPLGRSRLLRFVEGGTFEDVTPGSGLSVEDGVIFAEMLDYDQDGAPDLLLVTPQSERFHRNLGGGLFEEVALELPPRERAGLELPGAPGLAQAEPAREPSRGAAQTPGASSVSPGGALNTSGPSVGPGVMGTPTPNLPPISSTLMCAGSVEDFSNPGVCMNASSDPILGMLYPISSSWFVSPAGLVGLGTTSPSDRLHVEGRVRASGQIVTTITGSAPLVVSSTIKVANLNADLLDGLDSSAFRSASSLIGTADIADGAVTGAKISNGTIGLAKLATGSVDSSRIVDGTIVNADVSASAAIAGTKVNPNFDAQNVVTSGRGGFGTLSPNSTLHSNSLAGENALRAQVAGATKLLVAAGGGVSVGTNHTTPPADGLYVHGNLGVGNLSPTNKLDVTGNINATGNYRQNNSVFLSASGDFFGRDTGWPALAYNLGTSGLGMGVPSANNLAFQTLGLERLRITNSGRVGIGVTNPGFRLDLPNIASVDGQGRANGWMTYSSKRWKENVQVIEGALELVLKMRGVTFDWIAECGGEKGDVGFIAEEVGALVPQLVAWEEDGRHAKSLKYDRISAITVEAIKEQQVQIEGLRIELEQLESQHLVELAAAEQRIGELEVLVAAQSERLERLASAMAALLEAPSGSAAGR